MGTEKQVTESKPGFKLDPQHRPECFYKDEDDVFVVYDGFESRTKNGHRGGHTWWHRFKCNDPDCPARVLVRWDVLADVIRDGVAHG